MSVRGNNKTHERQCSGQMMPTFLTLVTDMSALYIKTWCWQHHASTGTGKLVLVDRKMITGRAIVKKKCTRLQNTEDYRAQAQLKGLDLSEFMLKNNSVKTQTYIHLRTWGKSGRYTLDPC